MSRPLSEKTGPAGPVSLSAAGNQRDELPLEEPLEPELEEPEPVLPALVEPEPELPELLPPDEPLPVVDPLVPEPLEPDCCLVRFDELPLVVAPLPLPVVLPALESLLPPEPPLVEPPVMPELPLPPEEPPDCAWDSVAAPTTMAAMVQRSRDEACMSISWKVVDITEPAARRGKVCCYRQQSGAPGPAAPGRENGLQDPGFVQDDSGEKEGTGFERNLAPKPTISWPMWHTARNVDCYPTS